MAAKRSGNSGDSAKIAAAMTIVTPIVKRIATDAELRRELRGAADSILGVYRSTRVAHQERSGGPSDGAQRAHAAHKVDAFDDRGRVTAEVIDDSATAHRGSRRALKIVAAAGAASAAALLASRGSGRISRGAGRLLKRGARSTE